MTRLQPLALGVAFGVLWALYGRVLRIVAMFGWGIGMAAALASLYLGYGPSIPGALIGALWAVLDGMVAGVVIAWAYNRVARR